METKRTILAVALSMAVLFLWQHFFPPKRPVPAGKPGATTSAAPVPTAAPAAPGAPAAALPAPVVQPAPAASQTPATFATLENDRLVVKLSSRGATVVGASLKSYHDKPGKDGKPVQLLAAPSGLDFAGDARLVGGALGLQAPYREVQRGTDRVTYAWDSPTGVHVEKTYVLEPGHFDLAVTVRLRNGSSQPLQDRFGLVMVKDYRTKQEGNSFIGASYLKGGDLKEIKLKEIAKAPVTDADPLHWGALVEEYFLTATVPASASGNVRVERRGGLDRVAEVELVGAPFTVAPGGESTTSYRVYVGPKLATALAPVGAHLERVVDYGWFSVIARPLLAFLNAIYRVTGNYGIAIILLTTVVKGLFWPLSAKSYRSMQRMKDLQPKLQKLKERYGKDRERLNMEVMQLYKTHKVNPMGGCLPMLLQIPVFFALYRVLLGSIELRHAPFFLWIQDLSAPDRLFHFPFAIPMMQAPYGIPVLTLLMGASMFFQQKLSPATGMDETQMKMMLYGMPIMFTFMFINFPAGLVLYWLVNNILSIAQQAWMMKQNEQAPQKA